MQLGTEGAQRFEFWLAAFSQHKKMRLSLDATSIDRERKRFDLGRFVAAFDRFTSKQSRRDTHTLRVTHKAKKKDKRRTNRAQTRSKRHSRRAVLGAS